MKESNKIKSAAKRFHPSILNPQSSILNQSSILFTIFFLFIGILFYSPAHAVLNLELTQGTDNVIPITVVPFKQSDKLPIDINQVMENDLKNSGQFNVTVKTVASDAIDFSYWRNQKVDNLLVGSVTPQGTGQYRIQFKLLDVYKGSQKTSADKTMINPSLDPIIAQQSFIVHANELRSLAHKISDIVFEKLTGIKGIFSTKIAYILVKRTQGKAPVYSLEISDMDGQNARAILTSDEPIMSPSWSPDNKQIAYVSFEERRAALYRSNVMTGQRHLISVFPGINGAPAWSPDGKQLAFVLSKTGYPKIYLLNLDAGKLTQMTDGWSIDTEPSWSPDGKSLLFTSNRGGGPQVYQMNLMTHQIARLTFDGNYNASASMTSDGKQLVFMHRDDDDYNIAVQDLASGDLQLLTHSSDNQSPSVSPNGQMIVFATNENDRGILALVSMDGKVRLSLPENEGEVREPAWSGFY